MRNLTIVRANRCEIKRVSNNKLIKQHHVL